MGLAPSGDEGIIVRSLSPSDGPSPSVIFGRWRPSGSAGGEYAQIVEPSIVDTADVLVAQASYAPGSTSVLIRHNCEEVVLVLEGEGSVLNDGGQEWPLCTGDLALIRAGSWHAMMAGDVGLGVMFWFPTGTYPPTD